MEIVPGGRAGGAAARRTDRVDLRNWPSSDRIRCATFTRPSRSRCRVPDDRHARGDRRATWSFARGSGAGHRDRKAWCWSPARAPAASRRWSSAFVDLDQPPASRLRHHARAADSTGSRQSRRHHQSARSARRSPRKRWQPRGPRCARIPTCWWSRICCRRRWSRWLLDAAVEGCWCSCRSLRRPPLPPSSGSSSWRPPTSRGGVHDRAWPSLSRRRVAGAAAKVERRTDRRARSAARDRAGDPR